MELLNKRTDDIRGLDKKGLNELEVDIRRELALMRMDVSGAGVVKGKKRGLKATLARALTVRNEQARGVVAKKVIKK